MIQLLKKIQDANPEYTEAYIWHLLSSLDIQALEALTKRPTAIDYTSDIPPNF